MNNIEIGRAMAKLINLAKTDFFSSEFYKNPILKEVYINQLGFMNFDLFDRTISIALSKHNKFPLPADLKKAHIEAKQEQAREIEAMTHDGDCPLCENRGMFFYYKEGIEYIARCICDRGKKYLKAPRIDSVFNMQQLITDSSDCDGFIPVDVSINIPLQTLLKSQKYAIRSSVPGESIREAN